MGDREMAVSDGPSTEDRDHPGDPAQVAWDALSSSCDECHIIIKEAEHLRNRLRSLEREMKHLRREIDARSGQERKSRERMEQTNEVLRSLRETGTDEMPDKETSILIQLSKDREHLDDIRSSLRTSRTRLSDLEKVHDPGQSALRERMERLTILTRNIHTDIAVIEAHDWGERKTFRLQLAQQTLSDIKILLGARA